jgi:hypothetical protein
MMEPSPTLLEERTARTQKHKYVSLRKRETYFVMLPYTYDLSITLIRSQAGDCLTTKNVVQCQAI